MTSINGQSAHCARLRRSAAHDHPLRVILLHGMGMSGSVWDGVVGRVSSGCEIWEADLPWTRGGSAEWTADQDVGQWVGRALASGPEPGFDVVVAHSFSATALLEQLGRAGQGGLRAVVLIAPFYREKEADFDLAGLEYSLKNFCRLFEQGINAQSRKPISPTILRSMAEHVCGQLGPRVWIRFSDTYLSTPRIRIDRLTAPVLIIGGDTDIASFPSDSKALAARLRRCWLEILEGSGHFPMADNPERVAALVNSFLGDLLTQR